MDYSEIRATETSSEDSNYGRVFQKIKHLLVKDILKVVYGNKKLNRRPKPDSDMVSRVLDVIFEHLDNGSKITYLKRHYNIYKGTHYRYQLQKYRAFLDK